VGELREHQYPKLLSSCYDVATSTHTQVGSFILDYEGFGLTLDGANAQLTINGCDSSHRLGGECEKHDKTIRSFRFRTNGTHGNTNNIALQAIKYLFIFSNDYAQEIALGYFNVDVCR
jgi:hypothetical protein